MNKNDVINNCTKLSNPIEGSGKYYVVIADPKCGFIVKMIQENNFPSEFTLENAIIECEAQRKSNICASYIPVP